jgi:hypothetical protein
MLNVNKYHVFTDSVRVYTASLCASKFMLSRQTIVETIGERIYDIVDRELQLGEIKT